MYRLLAAALLAGLGTLAGAQQPGADPKAKAAPPRAEPKAPPVVLAVTAGALAETFATNELRAEDLFVDKPVQVTGRFVRVAANRTPVLEAGKDAYQVELEGRAGLPAEVDVTFYFPRSARESLAPLLAGQEVVIQGRCDRPAVYPRDGRARLRELITVAVYDCTLVAVVPEPVVPPPGSLPLVVRP